MLTHQKMVRYLTPNFFSAHRSIDIRALSCTWRSIGSSICRRRIHARITYEAVAIDYMCWVRRWKPFRHLIVHCVSAGSVDWIAAYGCGHRSVRGHLLEKILLGELLSGALHRGQFISRLRCRKLGQFFILSLMSGVVSVLQHRLANKTQWQSEGYTDRCAYQQISWAEP